VRRCAVWTRTKVGEISADIQLQEFGSKYESETLRNSKKLDMADVIIYVHDSSDTNSFSYISNLRVGRGDESFGEVDLADSSNNTRLTISLQYS